jgi:nucleotide-binding universal stress UspA family protein
VVSIKPEATGSVEEGYPADCILNMAVTDRADLIVMGRRGISGVERFLLGGVSSSVVSHSKCDILIVR